MHTLARLLGVITAVSLTLPLVRAQFEPLLTEANVTLQATVTTTSINEAGTERRPAIARLTHEQIVSDLVGGPAAGWTLVAVRAAPADLAFVDAAFHLYAVKGEQRVRITASKFSSEAFGAVAKYRERHLGQYVLDSSGTVTNHVAYDFRPSAPVAMTGSSTDGFASIAFKSRDSSDGFEVFFYAISSVRANTRGSFTTATGAGLLTLNVSVAAPRLVLASRYPEINYYTSELID